MEGTSPQKQLKTPREPRQSLPQPATHNLLKLSRLLNTSSKNGGHGTRFRTSVTLPNHSEEQLQLGALFLKHLHDPLAVIPVVVEMRRKYSPMSTRSCSLNHFLSRCFEEWLLPYLAAQLEVTSCYTPVLASSIVCSNAECNKLGNIFLGCLERDQRELAEELLARNINHLQLVEECFRSLLTNIVHRDAARQFVLKFLLEGEQLFLTVLINLLIKGRSVMRHCNSAKQLIDELQQHYQDNQQKGLEVCRSEITKDFTGLYLRLTKRLCYDE